MPHIGARDVRLPRVDPRTGQTADTPTINIWSAEELRRFLDFVTDHPLCWLWHVAAGTGVRRGELLAIAWDDVDLDTPAVRIHKALGVYDGDARRKDTKSGRPRTIHLDHATADAFRRQRQEPRRSGARRRPGGLRPRPARRPR